MKGRKFLLTAVLAVTGVLGVVTGCAADKKQKKSEAKYENGVYAEMDTSKGLIVLKLEFEKVPLTVCNFVSLAEGTKKSVKKLGVPFYDGLTFHRVIPNFMIQGGDPEGTGAGSCGYSFPDEFDSSLKHTGPGILSMANAGPGTNGSQFFITHKKTEWLDGKHTVFGNVIKGMDVVNTIAIGDLIKTVKIVRVGKKAKAFKGGEKAFQRLLDEIKSEKAKAAKKAAKEGEEKLAKELTLLKKKYGKLITDKSGLMYVIHKAGKGEPPKSGQKAMIHYTLTLSDGRKIDSSYDRDRPFEFTVDKHQVIKAWDVAVKTMKVSEKRTMIVPPELAYGTDGIKDRRTGQYMIPPYSYLIFDMELVSFK